MFCDVILVGCVGQDAEIRHADSNGMLVVFSVAVTKVFNDRSGSPTQVTYWHQVCVRGKMAEVASKFITKGKLVLVKGEYVYNEVEDKINGGTRKYYQVSASFFRILDKKSNDNNREETKIPVSNNIKDVNVPSEFDTDDLPF